MGSWQHYGAEFPLEAEGVVDFLSGILFGSNENWLDLCLNPQTRLGCSLWLSPLDGVSRWSFHCLERDRIFVTSFTLPQSGGKSRRIWLENQLSLIREVFTQ